MTEYPGFIIAAVATLIEENGQGMGDDEVKASFPQIEECTAEQMDGILFYNATPPRRKRDYGMGWYVRRTPRWQDVWLARFGEAHPEIADTMRGKLLPVREARPYYGDAHRMDTADLIRQVAYSLLMREKWSYAANEMRAQAVGGHQHCEFASVVFQTWNEAAAHKVKEVEFRAKYVLKVESISGLDAATKKLLADYKRVMDFVTVSHEFVYVQEAIIQDAYYSPEFVQAFIQADVMDASIGEVVPVPPPDKIPVRLLGWRESVVRWIKYFEAAYEAKDKDDFLWDDALTLARAEAREFAKDKHWLQLGSYIDDARKRLARMMGEKWED